MTKKDYELIASCVKTVYEAEHNMLLNRDTSKAVRLLAKMLGAELSKDNPRFNEHKFLVACGVIER